MAMKYRKGREIGLVRDNRCSPLRFEEFFQLQELLFVQLPTCPGYEERRPDSGCEEDHDNDNGWTDKVAPRLWLKVLFQERQHDEVVDVQAITHLSEKSHNPQVEKLGQESTPVPA